MSSFGVVSSFDSIPVPQGMDVKQFDAQRKKRKKSTLTVSPAEAPDVAPATSSQIDLKSPEEMSFVELDGTINAGLLHAKKHLIPYLVEMRERLHAQGRRADLPDTPKKLTWQSWVESKKELLGSLSTVNRLLAENPEKKGCAKCGNAKGHDQSCPKYRKPKESVLSALETKFVDAALTQHAAIQDFYAGRTDADTALKSVVATIPTHDRLEEYSQRGSAAVQMSERVQEQQNYIAQLEEEITRLNGENESLQKRADDLNESAFTEYLSNFAPAEQLAIKLKSALAAEPDCDAASTLLTDYLQTMADQFGNDQIKVRHVSATITFAERNNRIMPGDYLFKQSRTASEKTPTLALCTGVAEFMNRRKVREWINSKWEKEHVIYAGDQRDYRVVDEETARELEPSAFASKLPSLWRKA